MPFVAKEIDRTAVARWHHALQDQSASKQRYVLGLSNRSSWRDRGRNKGSFACTLHNKWRFAWLASLFGARSNCCRWLRLFPCCFCCCALAAHQAFATDASLEEMNKQIGKRIKEAAAQLSTMRVWHANASIGKYVKRAADDAAAGKLKLKGVYTATKSK
jgi:hypothetical protein